MAIITEDYVSFETAKLLKEKGFPQEYDKYHSMVYNENDYENEYEVKRMVLETQIVKAGTLSSYPVGVPEPKCYCCTLQMAIKWLREVHELYIEITPSSKTNEFIVDSYRIDIVTRFFDTIYVSSGYNTYEQACEAAIKYCLENLI